MRWGWNALRMSSLGNCSVEKIYGIIMENRRVKCCWIIWKMNWNKNGQDWYRQRCSFQNFHKMWLALLMCALRALRKKLLFRRNKIIRKSFSALCKQLTGQRYVCLCKVFHKFHHIKARPERTIMRYSGARKQRQTPLQYSTDFTPSDFWFLRKLKEVLKFYLSWTE